MKLIIDIGNTLIKLFLFDNNKILKSKTFSVLKIEDIHNFSEGIIISNGILSSVKNLDQNIKNIISNFDFLFFDNRTRLPINIKYKNSNLLGRDRIAAAVGANHLYPKKNILVLDFGTCLTFDFVNSTGDYLGGRISPGLKMRYRALNQFTSQLPLVKIKKQSDFYGNDTHSSINSGIQEGLKAEISYTIDTFVKENINSCVIFTGGDSFFFEKELKNEIFVVPNLVAIGLHEILKINE